VEAGKGAAGQVFEVDPDSLFAGNKADPIGQGMEDLFKVLLAEPEDLVSDSVKAGSTGRHQLLLSSYCTQ
jgi:hypothetical protein